jgi:poly-gamma-glutamate capsule biosynthesis protein CapA/YwtB (metallophosphatase superfamily)
MRFAAGLTFVVAMAAVLIAKLGPTAVSDVVRVIAATPAPLDVPIPPAPGESQITILLAGDTGLNGSYQPVYAGHGIKNGARLAWNEATADIAGEINADINFANLETVVTDRNDIKPELKLFAFRTHPDGVRHLVRTGLNAFSTANNHAMDFGTQGAVETLKHLGQIGVVHAGLGRNRTEARTPRLIAANGSIFALGALGIIGNAYSSPNEHEKRAGQLSYSEAGDLEEAVATLAATQADYRILSVHYGPEFEVKTSSADRRRLTQAVANGADMVVGHHQHVVNGVEIVDGAPIFYGLGNFLHWGTQDMGRFDICRDYGLIARVHLTALEGETPKLRAIEAIPVTNMHKATRRLTADDARARIQVLNHLASQFGERGVRFAPEADGTGLYCAPGAETRADNLGSRCRKAKVTPPEPKLAAKIEAACGRRVVRVVENEEGAEPEFEQVGLAPELLPTAETRR